jgi:WD40 repeat protein
MVTRYVSCSMIDMVIRSLTCRQDFVLSVALTPDGQWVLSGSKDRGVQFWDPTTGHAQLMLQGHKNSGEFQGKSSCLARFYLFRALAVISIWNDGSRLSALPSLSAGQHGEWSASTDYWLARLLTCLLCTFAFEPPARRTIDVSIIPSHTVPVLNSQFIPLLQ